VEIKTRRVKVTGPKGEIVKSFRHMPCELSIVPQSTRTRKGQYVNVKMWFGGSKQSCSVSTLKSLIRNMITGVTKVRLLFPFSFLSRYYIIIINNECRATDTG
jgi:large subunit ribosomal protein L9e